MNKRRQRHLKKVNTDVDVGPLGSLNHEDIGHVLWALVIAHGARVRDENSERGRNQGGDDSHQRNVDGTMVQGMGRGGAQRLVGWELVAPMLLHLVWLRLCGTHLPIWVLQASYQAYKELSLAPDVCDPQNCLMLLNCGRPLFFWAC